MDEPNENPTTVAPLSLPERTALALEHLLQRLPHVGRDEAAEALKILKGE